MSCYKARIPPALFQSLNLQYLKRSQYPKEEDEAPKTHSLQQISHLIKAGRIKLVQAILVRYVKVCNAGYISAIYTNILRNEHENMMVYKTILERIAIFLGKTKYEIAMTAHEHGNLLALEYTRTSRSCSCAVCGSMDVVYDNLSHKFDDKWNMYLWWFAEANLADGRDVNFIRVRLHKIVQAIYEKAESAELHPTHVNDLLDQIHVVATWLSR